MCCGKGLTKFGRCFVVSCSCLVKLLEMYGLLQFQNTWLILTATSDSCGFSWNQKDNLTVTPVKFFTQYWNRPLAGIALNLPKLLHPLSVLPAYTTSLTCLASKMYVQRTSLRSNSTFSCERRIYLTSEQGWKHQEVIVWKINQLFSMLLSRRSFARRI